MAPKLDDGAGRRARASTGGLRPQHPDYRDDPAVDSASVLEGPGPSQTSTRPLSFNPMDPNGTERSPSLPRIERIFVQVFALVGEAIAGSTHALLTGDREAAKHLMERDELVDPLTCQIAELVQAQLLSDDTDVHERRELVVVLRMLPDLERNGDLAEHIARRAARGLGAEMSLRSRGLVERMGEVATTIWSSTADAFAERSVSGAAHVDDLDDELDDLHVTLTAELVAGTMPLPVAIELAMVARFYERFDDHAVNPARRMATLAGSPSPGTQERSDRTSGPLRTSTPESPRRSARR
jgi:phosphate transport system protein